MQDVVKTMKDDLWFRFVASLPFHVVAMVLQILLDKLFHGPAVLELGEIRYSRHGLVVDISAYIHVKCNIFCETRTFLVIEAKTNGD
jgi:hypothetical protein